MDEQNKPNARRKKIVGEGKSIEIKGEGLGTGPVGQNADVQRPVQNAQQTSHSAQNTRPVQSSSGVQRPAQSSIPFGGQNAQRPAQSARNPQHPVQSSFPFGGQNTQRPVQSDGNTQRPVQSSSPFGRQSAQRPSQASQSTQRPAQHAKRPPVTGGGQRASGSGAGGTGGGQRAPGPSGGGSKLILLIVAAVLIFFLGKNFLGGGNSGNDLNLSNNTSQTQTQSQTQNQPQSDSGNGGINISNLLDSFLGSSSSSSYDFNGILSGLSSLSGGISGTAQNTGSFASSDTYQQYFTTNLENNTAEADTSVSSQARKKYTVLKGGKKDTMTILVYMCGADLESQNGMATSDLKEMVNADLSDKVNLLVYTGGAKRWKNNVVSSSCNQIYKIEKGSLTRLVEDGGSASMTSPSTLASFIQFGKENYPANRMCLILWDHGGGSISGYGYDERYGQNQTMTLAGINEALKKGGVQFDFIGFDTCLMATVENGLMLDPYADYMIASEESEPGVGWYYTNWLSKVSSNPSMSTVQIGKTIVDDFVEVCDRQCRGQATTLSVVDLAELSATVPAELKDFSVETNEMIQNKEYKKISTARSKTREFASSSKIDQIDLVHFAKNMGTSEGKQLADALQGAIKYNRTGGGISNAYGLSIYFPYKRTSKVSQAVSAYKAIGMDDEYTRCIQEFASLEISGQLSSGSTPQSYSSGNAMSGLLESLTGGGSSYGSISSGYSSGGLESLLGGYFGGGSSGSGGTGSILDLLIGRSMTAERASEYILENHFDPAVLQWQNGRIALTDEQWSNLISVEKNMFFDNGNGYIDMGYDPFVEIEGKDLVYEYDGTWFSIDLQPVPYYRVERIEQDNCFAETGYVPAVVNGIRANLILVFDQDHEDGYIAGAETVYLNGETDTQAKNMISIGEGDVIQFVCDFYDYNGNYRDSYYLADPITLGKEIVIGYATVPNPENCRLTYCLTDIYQQQYWTPVQ